MNKLNSDLASGLRRMMPVAAALMLAGCAILPHATPQQPLRTVQQADFVAQGTAPWPELGWWQQFDDLQLNHLIELALQNGPSIDVVRTRVGVARTSAEQAASLGGARLDLDGEVTRQRYSANSIYPPPLGGNIYNSGHVALDFKYDFDWWGKDRAALEAALGRSRAAEADAAGAAQTLAAAVSEIYFQYLSAHERQLLSQQGEQARADLVKLQQQRVKAGLEAGETLEPLQADLESTRQQTQALASMEALAVNQLRALVGVPADAFPKLQPRKLPKVSEGMPANLPLNLVGRRADIAAAREQVYAANQDLKRAKAAFYPDLNLSAFVGFDSIGLAELFKTGSHVLGVTPALSLPIFHNGQLQAAYHGTEAQTAQAIAQYNQTLQNAVQEVNDAALRLKGAGEEAVPLKGALAARERDHDLLARQAKVGLTDGRNLLKAQLAQLALQDQQQQLNDRALNARVDLYKALGGGYRDETQTAATSGATR